MTNTTEGLIIYFSHTGYSERAAQALAAMTNAEMSEWGGRPYKGALGILRGMIEVFAKSRPRPSRRLPTLDHRPWVVVAGPVWAGQPAPPLRTMLEACRKAPDLPVGLLLTCSDPDPLAAIKASEDLLGRDFVAQTSIRNDEDGSLEMAMRLEDMCSALQSPQNVSQPA